MSRPRLRLARFLVALYPRVWRARYEDELLALVEDDPPALGGVFDLAVGAAAEWLRRVIRWQPTGIGSLFLTGALDQLIFAIAGAILALIGAGTGRWLAAKGFASPFSPLLSVALLPLVLPLRWGLASLSMLGNEWKWMLVRPVELALWFAGAFVIDIAVAMPYGGTHYVVIGGYSWWEIAARGAIVQLLALGGARHFLRIRRGQELRARLRTASRDARPGSILLIDRDQQ